MTRSHAPAGDGVNKVTVTQLDGRCLIDCTCGWSCRRSRTPLSAWVRVYEHQQCHRNGQSSYTSGTLGV